MWWVGWPQEIHDRLVTDKNPNGDITNLDLEMLGTLLGWIVLKAITYVSLARVDMCGNNSLMVTC
jgi:hypothetical protein